MNDIQTTGTGANPIPGTTTSASVTGGGNSTKHSVQERRDSHRGSHRSASNKKSRKTNIGASSTS